MEYVVPLIIVLVIVVAVVVASRLMGRRNQSVQAPVTDNQVHTHPPLHEDGAQEPPARGQSKASRRGREITREAAQAASARLTPESHQRVYSLIAQRQVLNAVKEYRKATRLGLGEAAADVAALAEFPQPTPEPAKPEPQTPAPQTPAPQSPEPATPEPATPSADVPLTVEDIMNAASSTMAPTTPAPIVPAAVNPKPAATGYRYRAIVSQGEDVREVASTRLNEEIFGRIRQLALAGNYDGAAQLLREYADIGETEAWEFVSMIGPEE